MPSPLHSSAGPAGTDTSSRRTLSSLRVQSSPSSAKQTPTTRTVARARDQSDVESEASTWSMKWKKPLLIEQCERRNLDTSGNKAALLERLNKYESEMQAVGEEEDLTDDDNSSVAEAASAKPAAKFDEEAMDFLMGQTVMKLKAALGYRGLDKNGKKDILVQRLASEVSNMKELRGCFQEGLQSVAEEEKLTDDDHSSSGKAGPEPDENGAEPQVESAAKSGDETMDFLIGQTVAKLKAALGYRGLDKDGKKDILVQRLASEVPDIEELRSYFEEPKTTKTTSRKTGGKHRSGSSVASSPRKTAGKHRSGSSVASSRSTRSRTRR